MKSTNLRPSQRKLAAALCTTFLVSSACLFLTTSGDTANLDNDTGVHGDVHNSKGDSHEDNDHSATRSPIKHVIVVIGENRGFDHLFGVYNAEGRTSDHFQLAVEGHRERGWHARSELQARSAIFGGGAAVLLFHGPERRQDALQRGYQSDAAAQHQ
jgi:phospholipase C